MPIKRRPKKLLKHFSPFPSPEIYIRRNYAKSSEIYSATKKRLRKSRCNNYMKRKHCLPRRHSHNKCFIESPVRRDLRIKQSTDNSIRSHIDRLAEYRRKSLMNADDFFGFPFPVNGRTSINKSFYPVNYTMESCQASCFDTPRNNIFSANVKHDKSFNSTRILKRNLPRKRRNKKNMNQDVRNVDLNNNCKRNGDDDDDDEEFCYESQIKKLEESVKNFEKQREEFLSSLAEIQAKISAFRLPQSASFPTCTSVQRTTLASTKDEAKSLVKPCKSIPSSKKTKNKSNGKKQQMHNVIMNTGKIIPTAINNITSTKSNKIKFNASIMDNLSKMLLNTSQRPNTLRSAKSHLISKTTCATQQSSNTHQGAVGNGLMSLAQAFCSMATGF